MAWRKLSNNRTECRKKDFLWNPAHFNYSVSTFAIKAEIVNIIDDECESTTKTGRSKI